MASTIPLPCQVQSTEHAVLHALYEAQGDLVPVDELARRAGLSLSTVRRCVYTLRLKLKEHGVWIEHRDGRRGPKPGFGAYFLTPHSLESITAMYWSK